MAFQSKSGQITEHSEQVLVDSTPATVPKSLPAIPAFTAREAPKQQEPPTPSSSVGIALTYEQIKQKMEFATKMQRTREVNARNVAYLEYETASEGLPELYRRLGEAQRKVAEIQSQINVKENGGKNRWLK